MLVVKMYETEDGRILCDADSAKLAAHDQTVAMQRRSSGTPGTCDQCGLKARAA